MMQCIKCNLEIDDDSYFCDQCGEEVFVCSFCGSQAITKRCTKDGKIVVSKRDISEKSDLQASEEKPAHGQVTPVYQNKTVNHEELVLENKTLGLKFVICNKDVIGRNQGSFSSQLEKYEVLSGEHAKIYINNNSWFVEDLDSTNGTFYENKKIKPHQKIRLENSTYIIFANIEFHIHVKQLNKINATIRI